MTWVRRSRSAARRARASAWGGMGGDEPLEALGRQLGDTGRARRHQAGRARAAGQHADLPQDPALTDQGQWLAAVLVDDRHLDLSAEHDEEAVGLVVLGRQLLAPLEADHPQLARERGEVDGPQAGHQLAGRERDEQILVRASEIVTGQGRSAGVTASVIQRGPMTAREPDPSSRPPSNHDPSPGYLNSPRDTPV